MSMPEVIVWQHLRGQQMNGLKFRRQHSIGPYIVDFYCHDLRLVIELDGWSHDETIEHDQIREKYLQEQGLCTYHIDINRVLHQQDEVDREIGQLVVDLVESSQRLKNL
jgi:very-short-patch-repair endonuclease